MATPPRLIAIQHVDPSPRDAFMRRASAASALHGETTRCTLKPAALSGSMSGLTAASLRLAPSGRPQTTTRHRRGSLSERRVWRTAIVNASMPGNAAGSSSSAAVRRISPRRTEVRASAQISTPSSTAVILRMDIDTEGTIH
jgi:hypothetical protein